MKQILLFFIYLALSVTSSTAKESFGYKIIEFKGKVRLSGGQLVVPKNEMWVFHPGANILVPEKSRLVVHGKLRLDGRKDAPITIGTKQGYWRGITYISNFTPKSLTDFPKAIPTGLDLIRHTILKDIGKPQGSGVFALILKNHPGVFIEGLKILNGINYNIINSISSNVYILNSKFTGSFSYPMFFSDGSLFQTRNLSFGRSTIYNTVYSLKRTLAYVSDSSINTSGLAIDAHDSFVKIFNIKLRTQYASTFLSNSFLVKQNSGLLSKPTSCPVSMSHDSLILDYDAGSFCTILWPSVNQGYEEFPQDTINEISKAIKNSLIADKKEIPFSQYSVLRDRITTDKKFWKKISNNNKSYEPKDLLFFADNHYIMEWVHHKIAPYFKSNNKYDGYLRFQKSYALNNLPKILQDIKVDPTIAEMIENIKISRLFGVTVNHCAYKNDAWVLDTSVVPLKLLGIRHTREFEKRSTSCSDPAEDYFLNFDHYHGELARVYQSIDALFL
ncbi:MAG: hypothetical protein KAG61_00295 [Bacteriovoracaceae bacterium]|nr:hypothetical protein [Bacteriovoracaceae bacterium]